MYDKLLGLGMSNEQLEKQGKVTRKDFIQLYNGDGLEILPESKEFNFKCCSCGYIHKIKIEHTYNGMILRFYEAT